MRKFITKVFWFISPIVKFIDIKFTLNASIKKVTGDHYYLWRDKISTGMVFLSNANGAGSNLINPSKINHSAIYFGKGLRTAINYMIQDVEACIDMSDNVDEIHELQMQLKRYKKVLNKYYVDDDICYVIEAIGSGVVPTNLVKFLTTKDKVQILDPICLTPVQKVTAVYASIWDLGLPYDYGFSDGEDSKYCFEVVADAIENGNPDINLNRKEYKFLGIPLYDVYLSETFSDDSERFLWVVDS